MEKNTLTPILITSLIWLIIVLIVYFQTKSRTEKFLEKSNQKLEKINSEFNQKLEELLIKKNLELRASYEKGYSDSERKKELSVQIIPWKEEIDNSTLFKNKKSIKVGYKHQLYSNGMPCFEPQIIVVEELTVDKLNEENINRAFKNLESVMNNIPNTGNIAVNILGNGKDLASSLLKLTKNKK